MAKNMTEIYTSSFFSLLLLNDPESVEKNKDTDEIHQKIWYLMELEKIYNLKRFQFELIDSEEPIKTDEEFFKKMNALFKTKLRQPRTYNELINFYYLRINNLIGKLGLCERKKKKYGFEYIFDIEQYKNFVIYHNEKLKNKMIEEEKKNKFGSPKKFDVITNEAEQINILLSDDVNILKCLIDEVKEDNKKYDADDEKEAPKAVLNKKDDDTDDETDDEDPPPLDDPEIIDIFINGYQTQIQVY
jgi:hypothetical protein